MFENYLTKVLALFSIVTSVDADDERIEQGKLTLKGSPVE